MVYEYEATSEAECAHECRKKHNGECPFFITEYSWGGKGGTPGKCTRTLPTGHRNCNKRDHWEKSSPDVLQLLFNTQNLGICVFLCSHEQIYIYCWKVNQIQGQCKYFSFFKFAPKVMKQTWQYLQGHAQLDMNAPRLEHAAYHWLRILPVSNFSADSNSSIL